MIATEVKIKKDIRLLTQKELEAVVVGLGEKKFRSGQIFEWLWKRSAVSFEDMTNLSKSFRQQLEDHFTINAIKEDKLQRSDDGTLKGRYRLHDGHLIEAVLIPVLSDNRYTVCVSTQVGCSLTCTFCATGRMGRIRNLDASEIYDQVVAINRHSLETFGHPLTNIVYMGMGEPLLTYANVLKSIKPFSADAVFKNVLRAQYTKGKLNNVAQQGYLQEENIPPASTTETFIAAKFFINNERWKGVVQQGLRLC